MAARKKGKKRKWDLDVMDVDGDDEEEAEGEEDDDGMDSEFEEWNHNAAMWEMLNIEREHWISIQTTFIK